MKPYRITAHVTTEYTLEVHGEDENAVIEQAEKMDKTQIENAGEYINTAKVEVTDLELVYPEDEEKPEPKIVDPSLLVAPEEVEDEEEDTDGQ